MLNFIINWILSKFKKTGRRLTFTYNNNNRVDGYLFTPPYHRRNELIVHCHGGWPSISKVPNWKDVNFYVNHGFHVFCLRYEDEFTSDPHDLEISRDILEINTCGHFFAGKFEKLILMGASRGGFAVLQATASAPSIFHLVFAMCAPTEMATFELTRTWKTLPEGVRAYFKQIVDPVGRVNSLKDANLVLIYGTEDNVVPLSQGIALGTALAKLKANSLLTIVEKGHALLRDRGVMNYVVRICGLKGGLICYLLAGLSLLLW